MSGDTKKSCLEKNSEDAIKWAAENDLTVLFPKDNQLFLDIDTNEDRDVFNRNRELVDEVYGIVDVQERSSRSRGNHCHLIITLRESITPLGRITLQAILGSDRRREAHSLRRLEDGEARPTLFFEKPIEPIIYNPCIREDGYDGEGNTSEGWEILLPAIVRGVCPKIPLGRSARIGASQKPATVKS